QRALGPPRRWRALPRHRSLRKASIFSESRLAQVARGFNPYRFLRGIGVRQVRLAAGLILFSYLLSHFINHSLGNISLAAMEYGLWFHMALWRSLPGTLLLYPALAIHGSLGLWAL